MFFFPLLLFCSSAFSQINNSPAKPHSNWVLNDPLNVKYFVENKVQDSSFHSVTNQKVQFSTALIGTNYYFTSKSILFRYSLEETNEDKNDVSLSRDKEQNESKSGADKKNIEEEIDELKARMIHAEEQIELQWLGISDQCKLVSEEKGECKFHFQNTALASDGYKKLIYKNIYPNIDIEVVFHDSSGIKYNILLHPGAKLSDVKMEYSGYKTLKTEQGNLLVSGNHLSILDHAPIAFYKTNGEKIQCSFDLNNGIVQFSAGSYDELKETIIDPWIVASPICPSKVYDIQKDLAGNVYVNGGAPGSAVVQKYSSAGALLWTYNYAPMYMGDIATDNAGNTVVLWGCCGGERFRLDPSGGVLWSTSGGYEHWRLSYDTSKTILSVGGYFTSGGNNLGRLDPNTGNVTNQINYGLETRSIVTDLNGDIYSLHVTFGAGGNTASNFLNKTLSNFTPSLSIPSGYTMDEYGFNYAPGQFIGFNGIAVQRCLLYTYDGLTINAWKKCDLTLFGSVNTAGGVSQNCGGITVDPCYNVYAGSTTGIHQYDLFLNPISSINTPNTVYDLIYAGASDFLACGEGFIGSYHFGNISCDPSVNPCTNANITALPPTVCLGDSTILTLNTVGLGGNTEWYRSSSPTGPWSLIPGVSGNSYVFTPAAADTFYFETKIICGTDTNTTSVITVQASAVPTALITGNTPICAGENVTLTGSGIGTFLWWNTSNTSSTLTVSPMDTTTYVLEVTNTLGCTDTAMAKVVVFSKPIADFSPSDVCLNKTLSFNNISSIAAGTITGWSWDFGDVSPFVFIQSPSHLYTSLGVFPVTLIVTSNNGCKDTISKNTTVHILPDAQFSTDNVCKGSIVPFNDLSSLAGTDVLQIWSWNYGDGSPGNNNQNNLHVYSSVGTYTAQLLVISNFGCRDSVTHTVTINPNPVVNFSAPDTAGCNPLCVNFQNSSSIVSGNNTSFLWSFGDGSAVGVSPNTEHCYTNNSITLPLTFNVSLTVTSDSGCVRTLSKNNYIIVNPNPIAAFSVDPDITSIVDPVITYTNLSSGENAWNWNFGDLTGSAIGNPLPHTYPDTGIYVITLIVANQYTCFDTIYKTIRIEPDWAFYVPNSFTPNSDGFNDNFQGYGFGLLEYEMIIFDRWGNEIYHTKNYNNPWDGKANNGNDIAQMDVYVYVINIKDVKKVKHNYRGIVTLVR